MKKIIILLLAIINPIALFSYENKSNRISIIVNQSLSSSITDCLNIYLEDLKHEGYEPIIKEWSLEENPSPHELKIYLKQLYEEGGLQGAVLIGDLPIAMYKDLLRRSIRPMPFPTDHYYMDLESEDWKDTNGDGYFDKPIVDDNNLRKRAIWVSRLKASNIKYEESSNQFSSDEDNEVMLFQNYFKKNHEFRIGNRLYKERSWYYDYIDNSWFYASYTAVLNKATDFFLNELDKPTFLKLLTEDSNEIGMWSLHGKENALFINRIDIYKPKVSLSAHELNKINIQTAFLILQCCLIGNFTANNCFANALLFAESSGVQVISASTNATAWSSFSSQFFAYPFQEGFNFGESYLKYLSSRNGWLIDNEAATFYAGEDELARVILGDGTLKRQRYLIGQENIESGINILRSVDLRQKITPSHILPSANTLRYDASKNLIYWDRYYNETNLTYRLVKTNRHSVTEFPDETIYEGTDNYTADDKMEYMHNSDTYRLEYVWTDADIQIVANSPSNCIYDHIIEDRAVKTAYETNDINLMKYLLKSTASEELRSRVNNNMILELALRKNEKDMIKFLLQHGVSVTAKILMEAINKRCDLEIVSDLFYGWYQGPEIEKLNVNVDF